MRQRISRAVGSPEVVEGGDSFGEGHVDGLRAIRDLETPIDARQPGLGPKANQLLVTNAGDDGRDSFAALRPRTAGSKTSVRTALTAVGLRAPVPARVDERFWTRTCT
ncbi:hypothetical protein M8494_04760 [Serratia ureilytica]